MSTLASDLVLLDQFGPMLGLDLRVVFVRDSALSQSSSRGKDREHGTGDQVTTARLEAFSDAVIAIIITIMVLELGIPHGVHVDALRPLLPVFLAYALSFVNLGIYWNNHHHMLSTVEHVNGAILWANLHLLFWLSLFPFMTGWMGENGFSLLPVAFYGVVSLLAAIAYYILQRTIIADQGEGSRLAAAIGRDVKGKVSPVLYLGGVVLAAANRWVSLALYVVVALMWLVPDRRMEAVHQRGAS